MVLSNIVHPCCKVFFTFKRKEYLKSQFDMNNLSLQNRRNLSTYDDISIVQVYYGLPEFKLFTADVVMTWQEIVSK